MPLLVAGARDVRWEGCRTWPATPLPACCFIHGLLLVDVLMPALPAPGMFRVTLVPSLTLVPLVAKGCTQLL